MLAGGAAGAVYWLTVYPADIVKSKLQTDSFRNPAFKSGLDCARQVTTLHDVISSPYSSASHRETCLDAAVAYHNCACGLVCTYSPRHAEHAYDASLTSSSMLYLDPVQ